MLFEDKNTPSGTGAERKPLAQGPPNRELIQDGDPLNMRIFWRLCCPTRWSSSPSTTTFFSTDRITFLWNKRTASVLSNSNHTGPEKEGQRLCKQYLLKSVQGTGRDSISDTKMTKVHKARVNTALSLIAKNSYTKGTLTAVLYQLYVWHEKEGMKARRQPRIGTHFDGVHDLTANVRSVAMWKTIHTVAGYTVELCHCTSADISQDLLIQMSTVLELWMAGKRDSEQGYEYSTIIQSQEVG